MLIQHKLQLVSFFLFIKVFFREFAERFEIKRSLKYKVTYCLEENLIFFFSAYVDLKIQSEKHEIIEIIEKS